MHWGLQSIGIAIEIFATASLMPSDGFTKAPILEQGATDRSKAPIAPKQVWAIHTQLELAGIATVERLVWGNSLRRRKSDAAHARFFCTSIRRTSKSPVCPA